eukprot:scaffold4189_cov378-Prasinococcus_capsulatus_cf.AAC.14
MLGKKSTSLSYTGGTSQRSTLPHPISLCYVALRFARAPRLMTQQAHAMSVCATLRIGARK